MIEYKTCPVCGSEKIEKVLDIKDHSISKEDFEVYECSACTSDDSQTRYQMQRI